MSPCDRRGPLIGTKTADGARKWNLKSIVIEEFGVFQFGQAGIRDLVQTRRAAFDAVEHCVAKAGEVVGGAEGHSGIPHENFVHLLAGQAYFLVLVNDFPKGSS
jgi:hypothetical protein